MWVAVDKYGFEAIYGGYEIHREGNGWVSNESIEGKYYDSCIDLPKGSIKKLIGKELTWEDEPVEI